MSTAKASIRELTELCVSRFKELLSTTGQNSNVSSHGPNAASSVSKDGVREESQVRALPQIRGKGAVHQHAKMQDSRTAGPAPKPDGAEPGSTHNVEGGTRAQNQEESPAQKRIESLENRLADFNLWADGVGALLKPGSSLDSRLQGRATDLALVKSILVMMADSLEYCANQIDNDTNFEEGLLNLDSAIRNLGLIGAAIRRTGKASRNRRADRTFKPEEHGDFMKHLKCMVLLRPKEEALLRLDSDGRFVSDIDTLPLSPLQERLIEANLRRRHNFLLAQRRSRLRETAKKEIQPLGASEPDESGLRPNDTATTPDQRQGASAPLAGRSKQFKQPVRPGNSMASTMEGSLQYVPSDMKAIPETAKTQITSIASDAEFPRAPVPDGHREILKCPCCCQAMPLNIFSRSNRWKQHVIEDLCPYTCIAENCPTPHLLFCTKSEWEDHVRNEHLPRWQCSFCDGKEAIHPSMESMSAHLQACHQNELSQNDLSTLISWCAVQAMGIESCPLCPSSGPEDSPELVEHVLSHTFEFAMRALPWPQTEVHDLNIRPGNFNIPSVWLPEKTSDFNTWLNDLSLEQVDTTRLNICQYDVADHSALETDSPTENTDYFATNGYFDDKSEDRSSRAQAEPGIDTKETATASADPDRALGYTVGWICGIMTEFDAAKAFLDEVHDSLDSVDSSEQILYALGKMGLHHIVIAVSSHGEYGDGSATHVAVDMLKRFPNLRVGLSVGVGGGAPSTEHDIRLGDVVVNKPLNNMSGVIKIESPNGKPDTVSRFPDISDSRRKAESFKFNRLPYQTTTCLQTAAEDLTSLNDMGSVYLSRGIDKVFETMKGWSDFGRTPETSDLLFGPEVTHPSTMLSCEAAGCLKRDLVKRDRRKDEEPIIHHGTIASFYPMRDAITRDLTAAKEGVLCFEGSGGADLMAQFPCLVIRGICDYADSHSNLRWRGYASMTSAAYAKTLLGLISPSLIETEMRLSDQVLMTKVAAPEEAPKTIDAHTRLRNWLSPTESFMNEKLAREHRVDGTGTWLFQHPIFQSWESGELPHLLVTGPPGCGKTVLSTAVADYLETSESNLVLRFFFDFADVYEKCYASIFPLEALFDEHDGGNRPATSEALSNVLIQMLAEEGYKRVFFVLDAIEDLLGEQTPTQHFFNWIEEMAPDLRKHHGQIFFTARHNFDLETWKANTYLPISAEHVDRDLMAYIVKELQQKELSSHLPALQAHIFRNSNGLFLLASLQIKMLSQDLSSTELPQAMPRNLNEAYSRVLLRVPTEIMPSVVHLLQFMIYMTTPLDIRQAVNILVTEHSKRSGYKPKVMTSYEAIISSLPIFLKTSYPVEAPQLRFCHSSCRDYFVDDERFSFERASVAIVETFLSYFGNIRNHEEMGPELTYPLATLALTTWVFFAHQAQQDESVMNMIVEFLEDTKFHGQLHRRFGVGQDSTTGGSPWEDPLYYACMEGMQQTAERLIDRGAQPNGIPGLNPLVIASERGHDDIVRLLLNHGADVNHWNGWRGSALQAASFKGEENIVRILLEHGADINATGGPHGNALCAASLAGHDDIVRLLLDHGADVNHSNDWSGSALQAASLKGEENIVQLLLAHGADIEAEGGPHGNAMCAASLAGNVDIVRALADSGADLNSQPENYEYGFCLQTAAAKGHLETVKMLLHRGADVNLRGGRHHTALQAASHQGHTDIVNLLLDRGGATGSSDEWLVVT